jgi:hypothetical protein
LPSESAICSVDRGSMPDVPLFSNSQLLKY